MKNFKFYRKISFKLFHKSGREGNSNEEKRAAFPERIIGTLLPIFGTFFKIGLFTFGGGLEMLPLFKKELVERHKWIDKTELMDIISISQSIPGSLTINGAAFLGRAIAGIPGAVVAIGGAVAAPMVCITVVVAIQPWIQGNTYVDHFFAGVRAAVAGLILSALLELRDYALHSKADYVVMVGAFVALEVFQIHFVYIIMEGILCSLFMYYLSCKNKIGVGSLLGLNLILSLCNYAVWYIFWAILALVYIAYRYARFIDRKKQKDAESTPMEQADYIATDKENAHV